MPKVITELARRPLAYCVTLQICGRRCKTERPLLSKGGLSTLPRPIYSSRKNNERRINAGPEAAMSSSIAFVTVVIPAFNAGRYITQAIESVLRQTCGIFELIVVDDGSTDQTRSVVERYGPLVRYEQQRNAGPASARNRGIELATGEFVAFLDADDLWHPEKCAVQMAHFNARSELVGCAGHSDNFVSEDAEADTAYPSRVVTLGTTLMVRRSLFNAVGMLDPRYWHRDLQDLLVRAEDRGLKIEILPDVLAQRRIHSTNMSNSRGGADQLELIDITRARHARRRAAGA